MEWHFECSLNYLENQRHYSDIASDNRISLIDSTEIMPNPKLGIFSYFFFLPFIEYFKPSYRLLNCHSLAGLENRVIPLETRTLCGHYICRGTWMTEFRTCKDRLTIFSFETWQYSHDISTHSSVNASVYLVERVCLISAIVCVCARHRTLHHVSI